MITLAVVTIGTLIGVVGGLWVALLTEQRKRYMAERELADIARDLAYYAKRTNYAGHTDLWEDRELPDNVVKFGKSA